MSELRTSVRLDLIDGITRPLRRIQGAMQRFRQRAGLDRLAAAGRGVSEAFGRTVGAAGRLAGRLAIVGGAATGAVWALERLVSGVTNSADAVLSMSRRLGVGVEWLQRWQGVAQRFGVQNEALRDGLKELSLRVDEAVQTGSGPAADMLQRLGFSREELAQKTDDVEGLFAMVLERIRGVQDASARQRIADELFGGQGGEQLVEMLGASRSEIAALMQQVEASGGILNEAELERARQYNRRMANFAATFEALRKSVVIDLLPALNQQLQRLTTYLQNNSEVIRGRIIDGLERFWEILQQVGGALKRAAGLLQGWGNLLGAIAAIMAGPLLLAIGQFGAAMVKLGFVLAATPIGWFLAGITAIAGGAFLIYKNWDKIASFFSERIGKVRKAFDEGLIQGVLTALREFNPAALVADAINGIIEHFTGVDLMAVGRRAIDDLWNGITQRWHAMTAWLRDKVDALVGWLPDFLTGGAGGGAARPQRLRPGAPALGQGDRGGSAATWIGGELRISIDQEGRARVSGLRGEGIDLSADSGVMMPAGS